MGEPSAEDRSGLARVHDPGRAPSPSVGVEEKSVVVLGLGGSHLGRLLPVVRALSRRGLTVHVLTRAAERERVRAAGGHFSDVFGKYPIEAADRASLPLPSRMVSFAAAYTGALTADVAALRPALIVYDSFFVPAPLIGRDLQVPYVAVRMGHGQVPARAIAAARADPGVVTSAACRAAVESLRTDFGFADASPFSYLDGHSPHLNLYPEPAPFLDPTDRRDLQPLAFFGSLDPDLSEALSTQRPLAGCARAPRVFIAFGSVIWRYHAPAAVSALACLSTVLAEHDAVVLVSLGHHPLAAADREHLAGSGVTVVPYADQWGALKDADLFVTHHGLSSTHEAIYHEVPMLSCPFFGDQPAQAARCRELGLAAPLADPPGPAVDEAFARRAITSVLEGREAYAARLAEARAWELAVIDGRETVIDRMCALAGLR